jgi:chorismate-pyruvate lyase
MHSGRTSAGLLPSPWPLWQLNLSDGSTAAGDRRLSGPWRLLLLGDGSPTRHLESLSGQPVTIDLIAMSADDPGDPHRAAGGPPPPEIAELESPLLRRQVWLRCGEDTLAWAESWWNQAQADAHLREREQPIWRSLTSNRAELYREVDGLARVDAPWLEKRFGRRGPFWSRHYRFFRGGKELTVIREVFSPALERWLGQASAE